MERAKLSVLQTSVYKSVTELTSQYNGLTTNGFNPFVVSPSKRACVHLVLPLGKGELEGVPYPSQPPLPQGRNLSHTLSGGAIAR
jgi:hypothetical protein